MQGYQSRDIIFKNPQMNNQKNIVLLHGWSQKPNYFQNLKHLLNRKYKIYIPIMPGFNKNTIKNSYTLDSFADWLNKYLLQSEIENPIIVGHSFGGAVAANYLVKYKNSSAKLVLVDAAIIRDKLTLSRKLLYLIVKILKPSIEGLGIKKLLLRLTKLENSDYQKTTDPVMKRTFQNIIYVDLSEKLLSIKNKALIIWGENDKITPIWQGKKIHSLIKNSSLKIVKDAGHFPFFDNYEEFIKIFNNFLK